MAEPDAPVVRQRLDDERNRLGDLRESLAASLSQTESESAGELSTSGQHQADLGTETFEREKDLGILEQVENELADVEHALKRLDDGTYGTCEACGQHVGEDRLEALPATRYCIQHAPGATTARM